MACRLPNTEQKVKIFDQTKGMNMRHYSESICADKTASAEAMKLAKNMLKIAENGFLSCNEDSCMLLYGVIRDCGYKIIKTVEREQRGIQKKDNCCKTLH